MNSALRTRRRRGFSLVELLVVCVITGIIVLALGYFFRNYFIAYRETQNRMRLQRDMRTMSYWIRKDLTALALRNNNVDLKAGSNDFSFLAADDPKDTYDCDVNTADNGLDTFTYAFSGNKMTRTWDPGGTMTKTTNDFAFESLDASRGDTIAVNITLYDDKDSQILRSQYDGTLGNFDRAETIRRVNVELIMDKQPQGAYAAGRSPLEERAEIKSVTMYQKGS